MKTYTITIAVEEFRDYEIEAKNKGDVLGQWREKIEELEPTEVRMEEEFLMDSSIEEVQK